MVDLPGSVTSLKPSEGYAGEIAEHPELPPVKGQLAVNGGCNFRCAGQVASIVPGFCKIGMLQHFFACEATFFTGVIFTIHFVEGKFVPGALKEYGAYLFGHVMGFTGKIRKAYPTNARSMTEMAANVLKWPQMTGLI